MRLVFRDHAYICIAFWVGSLRWTPRRATSAPIQGILLRPLGACALDSIDIYSVLLMCHTSNGVVLL